MKNNKVFLFLFFQKKKSSLLSVSP